jgi:hypothetical protein
MWFELDRFSWLRRKLHEENIAQSKQDPETESGQTLKNDRIARDTARMNENVDWKTPIK